MSDEEKKAIESFKENNNDLSRFDDFNSYTQFKVKRDKLIIELIEKQQKEIEKLKEKIINFTIEDEKIFLKFGEIIEKKRWKNKIKSKIEELKDGTYDAKIILQKLLEE